MSKKKEVRYGGKPAPRRHPEFGADPGAVQRVVRIPYDPGVVGACTPAWTLRTMDKGGPWSCHLITEGDLQLLLARLQALESMTWSEIENQGKRNHHAMDVGSLCKAARDRLQALKMDDADEIYSLRITGARRLWGIRHGPIFRVLWWDPDHTVYPVSLR